MKYWIIIAEANRAFWRLRDTTVLPPKLEQAMPRFHFDIIDEGGRVDDDDGLEFADFATMQQEAMRAAGSMVSEKTVFLRTAWSMVIRDDRHKTVATLTFSAR